MGAHACCKAAKALLAAVPSLDGNRLTEDKDFLGGDIPSPANPPSGCTFHPRCPYATEECSRTVPGVKQLSDTHRVYCHCCN